MVDEPPPRNMFYLQDTNLYIQFCNFSDKIVIPPDELIIQDSLILGNLVCLKSLKTNN